MITDNLNTRTKEIHGKRSRQRGFWRTETKSIARKKRKRSNCWEMNKWMQIEGQEENHWLTKRFFVELDPDQENGDRRSSALTRCKYSFAERTWALCKSIGWSVQKNICHVTEGQPCRHCQRQALTQGETKTEKDLGTALAVKTLQVKSVSETIE